MDLPGQRRRGREEGRLIRREGRIGLVPYRVLPHTADTGLEATAADLGGLVAELATGMFALMTDEGDPRGKVFEFVVSSPTPEDLVVDALSEMLFRAECDEVTFSHIEAVEVDQGGLTIRATARHLDAADLSGPPIKAVTYHDLEVAETADGWRGRVYFDV